MRASVFVGTSLDGFIARADGSFDFLSPAGDEPHGYEEFMATVDALVIGRKTFETVLGFGGWAYGEKPGFVLTSRLIATAPPRAEEGQKGGGPAQIPPPLFPRGLFKGEFAVAAYPALEAVGPRGPLVGNEFVLSAAAAGRSLSAVR